MSNTYEHDRWAARIHDTLGREFADALGLCYEDKPVAATHAIRKQKPMMHLPNRYIIRLVLGNNTHYVDDSWHACSEFLGLADMLTDAIAINSKMRS